MSRTRARDLAWLGALALAGCGRADDVAARLLGLVPAEAELVVAIDSAAVAHGWLDRAVSGLLADQVPACVLDAARAASLAVVAWSDAGALIAVAGRDGPACPELERQGVDRVWVSGLAPAIDDRGFFAERERRQRWSALPAAPVRALADLELTAGVMVHAVATVDPRDGVAARLRVSTDDRETLLSLRDRYLRWRSGLDPELLGAAWPAIEALTTAEDVGDALHLTDVVTLLRPGEAGATAAALAVMALARGQGPGTSALPCPPSLGDFTGRMACEDGRFTLTAALRDELAADPTELFEDVRGVPVLQRGQVVGLRVEALAASDPLAWLGLVNGDVVDHIDGQPLTSPDQMIDIYRAMVSTARVELGVVRRGRRGVLRYEVR